jgi:hypothetical protein
VALVFVGALVLLATSASTAEAQMTVTVSWNRNSDSYTVGYRVYYGTAPGIYETSVDTGGAVSVPITLSLGRVYYFVVRGYNLQGDYGPASAEVPVDLRTPAPTAQITATLDANNVATVTWQTANAASATLNGSPVALSGTRTFTITAQTTYTVRATATDGRVATASATVTPTTITPAPTARITATLGANNVATVTWQTANAATATLNGSAVALSGTRTFTITASTTYTIRATAADGRTATASASVTVGSGAPGAPRNMTASVSGSRATLSWQAPSTGGTPTHYLIYVGTRSGSSDITNGYNVGNVLSVQDDLPKGSYYARVRAANASGTSPDSNEVRFRVGRRLLSPTGFTVTWTGITATLSWVASSADTVAGVASSADSVGDRPTNYVVEAGTAPGESNVARLNVGNRTTFTTVVPSGTYYVRIRAQNAEGESDPSEEIEVRAPGTSQGPTGLVSMSATGVVDLEWSAASGGLAATGYVVEAGSAPGLSDLARLHVGRVTRFTTTAPPGVYYVRVRAIYASGTSLPSNEIVVRR